MSTLRELQKIERISQLHLLQLKYVLSRFWELEKPERVFIDILVDQGEIKDFDQEDTLLTIYKRLRKVPCHILQ